MKIKARHKLIPAVLSLVIASLVMTNATYAWFTMNSKVEANGMKMTVVAPNNLLISKSAATGYDASVTATNADPLTALTHVSSDDGVNFFTTDNVNTAEDADAYGTYKADATWATVAAPTVGEDNYYVDYTYYLKTTGSTDVNCKVTSIAITDETLTNGTSDICDAVRFAVLDGAGAAFGLQVNPATFATSGDGITHYLIGTTDTPCAAIDSLNVNVPVVSATMNLNPETAIFTVPAQVDGGDDEYLTITVRVWIEGQDAACISENGGNNFNIDLAFEIVA